MTFPALLMTKMQTRHSTPSPPMLFALAFVAFVALVCANTEALSIPGARPVRKIIDTLTQKPRSADELRGGIANFYDKSSALWEDVWGEHLHHGYYDPPDRTDHQQAQIDMVDKLLDFASIPDDSAITKIVDVGCGLGGSTRHLASRYKSASSATGITLSPYQERRYALPRQRVRPRLVT